MPVVPDSSFSSLAGWTPDTTCCSTWSGLSPSMQTYVTQMSAFTLWALTGRRFGLTSVTVRPCNAPPLPPMYQTYPVNLINPWGTDEATSYYPVYIINGVWHNAGCAGINCCGAQCELLLPAPVYQIDSIVVDGATVSPTAYRVDDGHILVRTDGSCWPQCQDFNANAGATGTWTVSYQRGELVPGPLLAAQGILACEIAKACTGAPCRLPQRMQNLSRQGVTVGFVQPQTYLDRMLTNLPDVDMIVAQYNPGRLFQRPQVMSMDQSPVRQQTWIAP